MYIDTPTSSCNSGVERVKVTRMGEQGCQTSSSLNDFIEFSHELVLMIKVNSFCVDMFYEKTFTFQLISISITSGSYSLFENNNVQ